MCTACMKPVEYGDLSDIDEERDSSRYEGSYLLFSQNRSLSITQLTKISESWNVS